MKNLFLLIVLGLFISLTVWGQTNDAKKSSQNLLVAKASELHSNFDITIGYVPKSPYNAMKASISANNFLLKRVGGYVSVEKGVDSDYFSNTYGITTSMNHYVYLWGGVGWYTKSEIFDHLAWDKIRKELGIGLLPYKLTVIRLGWSIGIGPTFAVGFKIPL